MENPLISSHFYFSCVEFSNKGQVILGLRILKQIKGSKTEMEEEKEERGKEGWREGRRKEGKKGGKEGLKQSFVLQHLTRILVCTKVASWSH